MAFDDQIYRPSETQKMHKIHRQSLFSAIESVQFSLTSTVAADLET
ncbi:hypothetical protein ABIS04_03520 [Shewanella sp. H8]